jgi:hypothetical protein
MPEAAPRIKRGTRVTLRNVKVGSTSRNVSGYISAISGGIATINTWNVTRPLALPVAQLRTMLGGVS